MLTDRDPGIHDDIEYTDERLDINAADLNAGVIKRSFLNLPKRMGRTQDVTGNTKGHVVLSSACSCAPVPLETGPWTLKAQRGRIPSRKVSLRSYKRKLKSRGWIRQLFQDS